MRPLAEVVGCARHRLSDVTGLEQITCDMSEPSAVAELAAIKPSLVIHAQALSDVDRCELEPAAAQRYNVDAARHVTTAAEQAGALLVCMSTDYVFDGRKGAAYDERDAPNPISVYGRSKLDVERCALGYARGFVVRTSTLFGPGRINFCDHIVQRLQAGTTVEAFIDQVTSPTLTFDLAEALTELSLALARDSQRTDGQRIFHATNAGECSRVMFAQRVAGLLGYPQSLIRSISMTAQGRPAPRPAYSALVSRHLPRLLGHGLRSWEEALQAYLRK